MDWDAYKRRCDAPDAWSRWMLMETRALLGARPDLAMRLTEALDGRTIEKPASHRGGPDTDMFVLHMGLAEVIGIAGEVNDAIALGARTSAGRGLGGFGEAWAEYRRLLERQAQAQQY